MKFSRCTLMLSLMIMGLLFTAGCSDTEDTPDNVKNEDAIAKGLPTRGETDKKFLEKLSTGQDAVTLKMVEDRIFIHPDQKENEWEEVHDMLGIYPSAPASLTIYDGRTWERLDLFAHFPHISPLAYPMVAYARKTGFDKKLLIACDFRYDEKNERVIISGREYRLDNMTQDGMAISEIDPTIWQWMRYEKVELSMPELNKILLFDSEFEAYLSIIDMLRAEFGDVFRINEYLAPEVELDDDLVNLDEIKKLILQRYGSH